MSHRATNAIQRVITEPSSFPGSHTATRMSFASTSLLSKRAVDDMGMTAQQVFPVLARLVGAAEGPCSDLHSGRFYYASSVPQDMYVTVSGTASRQYIPWFTKMNQF